MDLYYVARKRTLKYIAECRCRSSKKTARKVTHSVWRLCTFLLRFKIIRKTLSQHNNLNRCALSSELQKLMYYYRDTIFGVCNIESIRNGFVGII